MTGDTDDTRASVLWAILWFALGVVVTLTVLGWAL